MRETKTSGHECDRVEPVVSIIDCRHKERLVLKRIGGDAALEMQDLEGNVKSMMWFQLKHPYKKCFSALVDVLISAKKLFVQ
jgi:hypothetical protein